MKPAKRIFSFYLVMLIMLCMIPTSSVIAAKDKTSGKVGDNITWSYSKHTLTLSGKGALPLEEYPWTEFKDQIKKVVVKEGVTSIPSGTFAQYSKLTALSLPKSMIDFPLNTMLKTPWYKAQKNGAVYLNGIACGYKGKMPSKFTLKIKDGTKSVASEAFSSQATLKAIDLPESVTYIGDSAFAYCENLNSVHLSDNLQFAGSHAFSGTPWFDKQPDGVVYIGKVANCYKGEMPMDAVIKLKDGTVSISPQAFYREESMAGIRIPESVKSIGSLAFYGTYIDNLFIPKSVTFIQENRLGAYFSKKIIVDPENPKYSSDETGVLFNKKQTQMYEYPGNNKAKQYRIPITVKRVQSLCFSYSQNLRTLIIPASVKKLDDDAVHHTSSVNAFKVSRKNPKYSSDKVGCLYNKDKTLLIRYPLTKATSFTIPKSVRTIGEGAFMEAGNLQTLTMYDNVTTIGAFAFNRCFCLENIRFSKNITRIDGPLCGSNPWFDNQPDGVVYVGKVAYQLKGTIKDLTFKNGTVAICDDTFYGDDSVRTVLIPKSITYIGYCAFSRADSAKTIRIENPKCEIVMEEKTFPKQATIYAAKGSTAQTYAETFGRKFVAI